MKLVLGKSFPTEPPKGFFVTKIFHPNVASNGEICVNTLKKDWSADLGIKHVLLVRLKCISLVANFSFAQRIVLFQGYVVDGKVYFLHFTAGTFLSWNPD